MQMYLAVGLRDAEVEAFDKPNGGHPKSSLYSQAAVLFFASGELDALQKAQAYLGNPPKVIQQVGQFVAYLDNRKFDLGSFIGPDGIYIKDTNDPEEGVRVLICKFTDGENRVLQPKSVTWEDGSIDMYPSATEVNRKV